MNENGFLPKSQDPDGKINAPILNKAVSNELNKRQYNHDVTVNGRARKLTDAISEAFRRTLVINSRDKRQLPLW